MGEERDYGDRIGELGRGLLRGAKGDFLVRPLFGEKIQRPFSVFLFVFRRGFYLFLLVFFYLAA